MAEDKMDKKPKKHEGAAVPEMKEPSGREAATVQRSAPWPFITIGVFVTVLLLALTVIVWAGMSALIYTSGHRMNGYESTERRGFTYDTHMRDRMYDRTPGMSSIAARGVVTAIDGDMVTVSGHGEQVKVKKTADTRIGGDKTTLAVNDTVIVTGDVEDDDSVTASRIVVRNDTYNYREYSAPQRMPNI